MSFFRRRRPGRHAEDGDVFAGPPPVDPEDDEEALETYVEGLSDEPKTERVGGPYDIDELDEDDDIEREDLGSLKIPQVEGVEIRFVQHGSAEAAVLVSKDSVLQLNAFAAPRSEGVWHQVRAELRNSILSQGDSVEEVNGPYGPELRAKIHTPNGPADARFVGFDGPRWFVKALFQGRAGSDPTASAALDECVKQLVVERGAEARPVNEPLPLTLPPEIAAQVAQAQQGGESGVAGADAAVARNGSSGRQGKRSKGR